ncbi:MAG: alpha/beta hydrolase-fold protein [Acidobacteriota bacterium]|jgi:phospholipase/carboxylesterase
MNTVKPASLLLATLVLALPSPALAQEGDRSAGRKEGQDLLYLAAPALEPIRIQFPVDYDAARDYPLVVGLHGHGGRGDEFFSPAPVFAQAGVIYAVLQAPYAFVSVGRIGYSWTLRGVDDDAGDQGDTELSIHYVLTAVDTLVEKLHPSSVYLMGFSQGGTMTYQTALAHPDRFDGIAVFGSSYRREWFTDGELVAASSLPVFIGHGQQDGVAPRSTESRDILRAAGFTVTFYDYPGGHMIARSAIDEMFRWMGIGQ